MLRKSRIADIVSEPLMTPGLTMSSELTARPFRDRIVYPLGVRRMANLIKQQCEKEAGTCNRLGIPFLLFALQRYLTSSQTIELERCPSPAGSPWHSPRSRPSSCMLSSSTSPRRLARV
jgi:hypothetical protein